MRKIATILCLTILSSSLAGCLWNLLDDDPRISFSDCPSSWHVEFFDHSNDNFGSWDGRVEFTDSKGNTEVLEYFSSNKKYVTLDDSLDWTMKYTFYEGDIGFIVGDSVYGGDNRNGDSGTIELDLVESLQVAQMMIHQFHFLVAILTGISNSLTRAMKTSIHGEVKLNSS
jgi:hypothetical protein